MATALLWQECPQTWKLGVLVSLVKLVLGKDDDLVVWSHLRGHTHVSNYHNLTTYLSPHNFTDTHICMQIQTGTFQVVCYLLGDLKVLC